jgi:type II secretory pathway pseudopilin PulG
MDRSIDSIARTDRGFTLVETIVAAGVLIALTGAMIELAHGARAASFAIGDMADAQQRLRVAAEAIQHDLLIAGAGSVEPAGGGPLARYVPPIRPSAGRPGETDMTYASDRISVLWIPETQAGAALAGSSSASGLPIGGGPACATSPACGFESGMQAIVFDPTGPGFGYDVFTVEDASAGWISQTAADGTFSRSYGPPAYVSEVVHHTYYLDRSNPANVRLMRGAGRASFPLVDGVEDLRFTYYTDSAELTSAALTDGPFCGTAPNRFDADLLRIRRIRVALRVASSAAAPRRATSSELSFDVAPRNLNASR